MPEKDDTDQREETLTSDGTFPDWERRPYYEPTSSGQVHENMRYMFDRPEETTEVETVDDDTTADKDVK